MNDMQRLQAIRLAQWAHENADTCPNEKLLEVIKELSAYRLFSDRQISRIIKNKLSHSTVSRITKKSNRTGGLVPPEALESLATILLNRHQGIDYAEIEKALKLGTSQNMVSKLTGVSQSTISRRFGDGREKRHN